jgi:predicted HicB family RNase H-like nuclease
MKNELHYKNYVGSCEVSVEDECLIGRILFIDDLIVYEGNTFADMKLAFEAAVDRYLAYCVETGKPANKPYSGNFNIRINKEMHKKAAQCAQRQGISLNQFVGRALERAI